MTKFEEDLNKKMDLKEVPMYFTQSGCSMTRKTYIEMNWIFDNYKNWHSDEELQEHFIANKNLIDVNTKLAEEIANLKSQLQQQALPVVPEFVAKDVKRLSLSTLADWNVAVSYISKETLEWLSTTGNINVFLGKSWTLCSLKINGFKVEKPQLFYLKNKLTGDCLAICLARASSGLYVEVTEKWLTRKEQTSYKLSFTQQEIDSMQTGSYEQIEVTE